MIESKNVLVAHSLTPDQLQQIEAVSHNLGVEDGAALLLQELNFTLRPGQTLPQPPAEGANLDDMLARAEVILAPRRLPDNIIKRAPNLKWVQLTSAGIDSLDNTGILDSDIILTSANTQEVPVTEWVLTAMLVFAKQVPGLIENRRNKAWERFNLMELHDRTLGIVGLGNIGGRMADLGKALGMQVVANRRSTTDTQLNDLLARSDFVVLTLPLTPETKGLIGEEELRVMKPSAVLINVARGPIVDEIALVRALKEEWIAGAALDVFQKEPLPEDSELWTLPNVFISPHIAGLSEAYDSRVVDLFCENLRRYMRGQDLLNLVNKTRGY